METPASLRWARGRAKLVLAWETGWTALLPLLGLALIFVALAWTGLLFLLPGWAHLAILILFAAVGFGLGWTRLRHFRWPDSAAVDRRIETASGLAHRPLTTLQDEPAGGDAVTFSLWQVHRARVLASLTQLRTGIPARGAYEVDPFGLRALVVSALIVGFFAAGPDRGERLRDAFLPRFETVSAVPPSMDVWATPPAYTNLPPLALSRLPEGEVIALPGGTQLSVQLSGYETKTPPAFSAPGVAATPLTRQSDGVWHGEATLPVPPDAQEGTLTLLNRAWPVRVLPDAVPKITFRERPGPTPRQSLRLPWGAEDDYGIESVRAEIRLSERKGEPFSLTLASPARKTASGAPLHDLTDHPWAGLPVAITLIARDGRGQEGRSEPELLILPARAFTHPVAKAIIDLRRALTEEPDSAPEVARALEKLAIRPQAFSHDTLVFLGLMSARARLILQESGEDQAPVVRTLWDLALRLEEGDLSVLERDLRDAQQAVQEGLEQDLTDPEMQQRLDAMQQALDRYMQALTRRAIENSQRADRPRRPRDPNARMVTNRDIQQMMDKARELARQGQKEQAQALLDQLRELMEQLANAEPELADGDESEMSEDDGDPTSQALQNLQDLARQQRSLMDRGLQQNRQRGQRGQQGQQGQQGEPQPGDGDMAGEQESLRRRLGEIMRQLGEANGGMPQGLGRAEQAMRDALSRLQQGQQGGAAGAQQQALDQLRDAMRGLADQQRQQAGEGQGAGQGRPRPGQRPGQQTTTGQNRDPLGRDRGDQNPGNGLGNDDRVRIPDDSAVERARTIFDDLRRRAADPTRPTLEREYIDRLLRGF
ncbi:TIGR02302 family protein [Elstera sp.]|jgi:uncharacterized protein (TIGR02302 family)|uniref:TIGR02302 family protein n=1 Tax=Elstera sp. TaxID=1916664 RepID=UPI0037BE27BE